MNPSSDGRIAVPQKSTRECASLLRRELAAAGYSFSATIERLGISYRQTWERDYEDQARIDQARIDQYIAEPPRNALDIAIRLLGMNVPLAVSTVRSMFSAEFIDCLLSMKLIEQREDDTVASQIALFECAGLFIATDGFLTPSAGVNKVMPLLPESYEFVSSASRKRVVATLDLCTGSGIHALVAHGHSEAVIGVDISQRAVAFSNFNCWLNGIDNASFYCGDLYEPVRGKSFDLILANPPYMPVTDCMPGDNFYCGGRTGDSISSKIVQGLATHLRVNGICQMIHMMISFDDTGHERKLRSWLGPLADSYSIVVLSKPISYRNINTNSATSVEFGVTSIKRNAPGVQGFYVDGKYDPPFAIDISDLFSELEQKPSQMAREGSVSTLLYKSFQVPANS
jgi:hypothetical protein